MPNRYLVLSDLHLADVEDHPDGWKFYKSRRFVVDAELAEVLARGVAETPEGDRLVLILNGDVFDFDLVASVPAEAPWPISRLERWRGLDATAERSAWKLSTILTHHPVFVGALVDVLAAGHEVVYVLGNHDREFDFPEVQRVLLDALTADAAGRGVTLPTATFRFEPWFYHVPGEIYAEHGHQYDVYSSLRYVLAPRVTLGGEEQIALPMGNLSNRFLMSRMGFFNPHVGEFILNVFRYLAHWLRYYAFTKRGILVPWLMGSLRVVARIVDTRRRLLQAPPDYQQRVRAYGARQGLDPAQIDALQGLQQEPIANRLFRLVRELWLDRLVIALALIIGTVTLALVPIPLWIKLMLPLSAFPLAFLIYETLARDESIFAIEKRLPRMAGHIADLLRVPVVTFGHVHVPRLVPLDVGRTFVDTGTWAPMTAFDERGRTSPGYRNVLQVRFRDGAARLTYGCAPRTFVERRKGPPRRR